MSMEILMQMDSGDWATFAGTLAAFFTIFSFLNMGWRARVRALQVEIDGLKIGFLKRDQMIAELNALVTQHHQFIDQYKIHVLKKPAEKPQFTKTEIEQMPLDLLEKHLGELRAVLFSGELFYELGDGTYFSVEKVEEVRRRQKEITAQMLHAGDNSEKIKEECRRMVESKLKPFDLMDAIQSSVPQGFKMTVLNPALKDAGAPVTEPVEVQPPRRQRKRRRKPKVRKTITEILNEQ